MHTYATDSDERKKITAFLAIISVGISYLLFLLLSKLITPSIWWFSAPSAFAVFGIMYAVFRRFVWLWPLLYRARLVKIPNLNGKWSGALRSSFDDYEKEYPVTIIIEQSWTHIRIRLTTEQSSSYSVAASLKTDGPEGISLIYVYQNQPRVIAQPGMEMHWGTNTLILEEHNRLEGDYFTSKGRRSNGRIRIERA